MWVAQQLLIQPLDEMAIGSLSGFKADDSGTQVLSKWQEFLKQQQPKTIIFWGQGNIFFTPEGGEAYLTELPKAEMHRLAAGHFATEDCLDYMAGHIHTFYQKVVA